ncbi:MAG TPA: hypothetical protein VGA55_00095 [Bacteroidota bacterium]
MSQATASSGQSFRHRLARWREFFFAQKYRFELGQSFLVVINFTLLIITASDKLQLILGIPRLRSVIILIVPLGFLGVWLFGYFMDKVVRAAQMAERQSMKRSEVWASHNDQMNRIEEEIRRMRVLVERGRVQKKARR